MVGRINADEWRAVEYLFFGKSLSVLRRNYQSRGAQV
jgi:hypothetical protein